MDCSIQVNTVEMVTKKVSAFVTCCKNSSHWVYAICMTCVLPICFMSFVVD